MRARRLRLPTWAILSAVSPPLAQEADQGERDVIVVTAQQKPEDFQEASFAVTAIARRTASVFLRYTS